jgi:hypothetical protein
MKTSQWVVALVVLAVLVFAVTLLKSYVGSPGGPEPARSGAAADAAGPKGDDLPQLKFGITKYPPGDGSQDLEYRRPGYHDFLFRNDSPVDVRVGVAGKNCKCSSLELFYLPREESARPRATLDTARTVGGCAPGALGTGPLAGALAGTLFFPTTVEASIPWVELIARKTPLVPDAREGVAVPAGAVGWVRMSWTGDKAGAQLMKADVWMTDPALRQPLEVWGVFGDPLRLDRNPYILEGEVSTRGLPLTMYVYCWSPTRDQVGLRAEVVRPAGLGPESDPFAVQEFRPLTPDELLAVRNAVVGPVLCGYRLVVVLHKTGPDGKTPCELGTFRREVRLVPDGGIDPLSVAFTGALAGDVTVGSPEDAGRVRFGSFGAGSRRTRSVVLRSSVPKMRLELEKGRVPDYVEAELLGPDENPLGRTWELRVTVLPDRVSGRFPRDDPAYRDSAIYLRAYGGEEAPQTIRVPVEGDAREGAP